MSKKYLIIGTSAAGLSAAHKIRQLDSSGSIMCFTKEQEYSYNKCLLADYVASHIEYPRFKTEKFFNDNAIHLVTDSEIVSIDREYRTIADKNGLQYSYDALLIATGGDLVRPESVTAECTNVFDFYTYQQTHLLKEYAQQDATQTILIIGAGLSGLECADALLAYKKSIIVIEKNERVLAHQIIPKASSFIEKHIHRAGIQFVPNTMVTEFIIEHNKVLAVVLSDGRNLAVDQVIYALGARANFTLPEQSGLEVTREGVIVNEYLQTSDSHIWAAGDLCRVLNIFTEQYSKSCTWPDAMQQGMYAAHNMVGISKSYKGAAPIISSSFFGFKFFVAGIIYPLEDTDNVVIEQTDNQYTMVLKRADVVKGFIIIGDNHKFFELKRLLLI